MRVVEPSRSDPSFFGRFVQLEILTYCGWRTEQLAAGAILEPGQTRDRFRSRSARERFGGAACDNAMNMKRWARNGCRGKPTDKLQTLVVGDVMLDRYWFGDVERISPEAPCRSSASAGRRSV